MPDDTPQDTDRAGTGRVGDDDLPSQADGQDGRESPDNGDGADSVPRTIHDAFFKDLFGDPGRAASALRAITPLAIAKHIDWNSLQPDQASMRHDNFEQTHGDLLFEAKWQTGPEMFLRVFYEHQSTVDWWMALRISNMVHALWRRWRKRHSEARYLPAVLSYVLYHGASPWSAPTSLDDLVAVPPEARAAIADYLPSLRLVLDDLRTTSDDDIAARDMTPYPKLALVLFKHGPADDLPEILARFGTEIASLLAATGGDMLWEDLVDYVWKVNPRADENKLIRALRPVVGPEIERTMISYAQKLKQEGHQEGRLEGRNEALRELLLGQLSARFGSLPEHLEARVASASSDELKQWAMRVLDAASLDAVFEPV